MTMDSNTVDKWTIVFVIVFVVGVAVLHYIIQKRRSRNYTTVYISDFHVYQR